MGKRMTDKIRTVIVSGDIGLGLTGKENKETLA